MDDVTVTQSQRRRKLLIIPKITESQVYYLQQKKIYIFLLASGYVVAGGEDFKGMILVCSSQKAFKVPLLWVFENYLSCSV